VIQRRHTVLAAAYQVHHGQEVHLDPEFDDEFRVVSTDPALTADQLPQTISIIRTHTPLPQSVKIPKPEDMLLQLKPSAR